MGGHKPVDLGTGLLCASFGRDGSWLSVGAPHPRQGFVELSALPPFDEALRGDPTSTRAYRNLALLDEHAVLRLEIDGSALGDAIPPVLDDPIRPVWEGRIGPLHVLAEAEADGEGAIRQRWWLALNDPTAPPRSVRLRACGRLDRPALAEISELQPPAPTSAQTRLEARGARLVIRAPRLPAAATLEVFGVATAWIVSAAGAAWLDLPWAVGEPRMTFEIGASVVAADQPAAPSAGPLRAPTLAVRAQRASGSKPPAGRGMAVTRHSGAARITRRAIAYIRGCTALRTTSNERAILTDHRLLPLSWTRDAYFQALLLHVTDGPGDHDRVADHLRWLWRRNERPDGRWVRSHHANGRRKDVALQADQQLYPIIELADFWRATAHLPRGVDWAAAVPAAWDAALRAVDRALGLMATHENAADDAVAAPYIAGSQIVLWYAARRLAELVERERFGLDPAELLDFAQRVRAAFHRHLVSDGRWAYATDEHGLLVHYHDANDLPIALAPAWGFCESNDPGWRATMQFAFSTANPGFWRGPMPGLGSAHTPGAWTLGDVQAWLVATLTADAGAASTALARLDAAATDDGMLPEAYTIGTDGRLLRIRHWFAWPGAAFGALWTLAQRDELAQRLAATP